MRAAGTRVNTIWKARRLSAAPSSWNTPPRPPGQQQAGAIADFEPVFLQPHGGELGGFVLVRGERPRLTELASSVEFERLMTRAQLIVEHFGVVNCWLGEEIERQMTSFQDATADLA